MNEEITFCACCGAKFQTGKGWIEDHKSPCANHRYGWAWTVSVWPRWKDPFLKTAAKAWKKYKKTMEESGVWKTK
jgi:hypothetical protein